MGMHNEWTKDSNYMGNPVQALLTPLVSSRPTPPPTPVINNIIPTDIKSVKRAIVIGIGGVGANLAFSLAKEGYELALIDHDFIEQKNVNRFAFTSDDLSESVGKLKVNVIEKILRKRDPREAIPQRFEDVIDSSRMQSFMARPFIAICCSDSKNSRQTIEKRLRKSPTVSSLYMLGVI
jgi:tRNA A37 threonylcarbamoyladenosine dehydratase